MIMKIMLKERLACHINVTFEINNIVFCEA